LGQKNFKYQQATKNVCLNLKKNIKTFVHTLTNGAAQAVPQIVPCICFKADFKKIILTYFKTKDFACTCELILRKM